MAILSYTVTLGAAATQVTSTEIYASLVRLENDAGNDLVKYGLSTLAADDYAGSIVAEQASASNAVVLGPFPASIIKLSDLYLLGTAAQKVRVTAVAP